ncbi:hypothetical protein MtrunA17_Chr5g0407801 [Medicago truncatula]|uniref:Uncharacterized protein n=1 Tax=Medicago truncatula TaxID=3880 RepID=A0A396HUZ1_MEDTR|nr:hypothetical protein MtrunA17_Chr5g0407801 [Medicago truncatula]
MTNIFALGWDDGGDAWNWRRHLFVWEKELVVECTTLLNMVTLQVRVVIIGNRN